MEQLLINAGLSELQAKAYLFLLENGPSAPKDLLKDVDTTRTNSYKLLESLESIGLAYKEDIKKKIIYKAADPSALASLLAEKRNNIIALENNVKEAIQQLRKSYIKNTQSVKVYTSIGKESLIEGYTRQANLKKPVYFIKTRDDIPFLGFETMDKIRRLQGKLSKKRYGITPDSTEAPLNNDLDKKTNLIRTWVKENSYTSPIEWSVSGDELLIQVFVGEGESVNIKSYLIAESFKQIWNLTDDAVKNNKNHSQTPIKAKREI